MKKSDIKYSITYLEVLILVSKLTGISIEEMKSKERISDDVSFARHLYYYLCSSNELYITGFTSSKCAFEIGKTHTMAGRYYRKIKNRTIGMFPKKQLDLIDKGEKEIKQLLDDKYLKSLSSLDVSFLKSERQRLINEIKEKNQFLDEIDKVLFC